MTYDHDDTSPCYFNTISGTCWKVSEFIDFDLKNRSSNLPACFSALICDFSQFIKIPLSKTMKRVLRIFQNLLFMNESGVSELYINLFVLKFSFCWHTIRDVKNLLYSLSIIIDYFTGLIDYNRCFLYFILFLIKIKKYFRPYKYGINILI